MLAAYLRQQGPIRYTLGTPSRTPPEHAEAMRNFLALHTRAFDLPHLAHLAQPHLQHPLLQSLLQSVLGEHDPQSIGPFLDAHHEMTGLPHFPGLGLVGTNDHDFALAGLLDNLAALHHASTGTATPYMGDVPSPAEIHRRYATGALQGLRPGPEGRPYLNPLLREMAEPMTAYDVNHYHALRELDRMMREPIDIDAMSFVPAYDAAHALSSNDAPMVRGRATVARSGIADALRRGILPYLHQGLQ